MTNMQVPPHLGIWNVELSRVTTSEARVGKLGSPLGMPQSPELDGGRVLDGTQFTPYVRE